MSTPELRVISTTSRSSTQTITSVYRGERPPIATRDTLQQQSRPASSREEGFFSKTAKLIVKAFTIPLYALAAMGVAVVGIFALLSMFTRVFSGKTTTTTTPVVNRQAEAIEKARTINLFKKLIEQRMDVLDLAGKAQFRQELRSSSPAALRFAIKAAVGLLASAGEGIEDIGTSDTFRMSWRGFLQTNGITEMGFYYPKIMRRYNPHIQHFRRCYDNLPSDRDRADFRDQYWRDALTRTSITDTSSLLTSTSALANRIQQEDTSQSFRSYVQEAAECYLREHP